MLNQPGVPGRRKPPLGHAPHCAAKQPLHAPGLRNNRVPLQKAPRGRTTHPPKNCLAKTRLSVHAIRRQTRVGVNVGAKHGELLPKACTEPLPARSGLNDGLCANRSLAENQVVTGCCATAQPRPQRGRGLQGARFRPANDQAHSETTRARRGGAQRESQLPLRDPPYAAQIRGPRSFPQDQGCFPAPAVRSVRTCVLPQSGSNEPSWGWPG
jgi:hypothetical protein